MNTMSTQGSALRAARVRAGRLAVEAAARLRVSEATVLRWERGDNRPTFDDVSALLDFYRETCPEMSFEDLRNKTEESAA